jgi:membrane protease YdiL (CAAX protease family)
MIQALRETNWRIFTLLFVAGLVGVLAILPMMAEVIGTFSPDPEAASEMPFPLIVALALIQNGVLLSVAIILGMILSRRVGLTMPWITAWATGTPPPSLKSIALPAVLWGAAAGVVIVGVEMLFFLRHLPESMRAFFEIPLWKRLLAGVVYGGITEELFMRLFLLSLVAWVLARWWKTADGSPTNGVFWAAIFLVALLFGLGHLPATAYMAPLTPMLVVRALALNAFPGVAFGYLFWRHGLEASMLGHMSAHLVMQGPGVMLLRTML